MASIQDFCRKCVATCAPPVGPHPRHTLRRWKCEKQTQHAYLVMTRSCLLIAVRQETHLIFEVETVIGFMSFRSAIPADIVVIEEPAEC
jgi:hypothetical protein